MKTHRPLSRIDSLPEDQRLQLADWLLAGTTLARTRELLKETYDLEIPQTNLHRFKKRIEFEAYLDDTEESSAVRAELINAAASVKPNFSSATLQLLERQMFELALDHNDRDRHKALGDIAGWIHKHKIDALRERQVKVQEEKLALKKAESKTALAAAEETNRISKILDHVCSNHPALKADDESPLLGSAGVPPAAAGVSPAASGPGEHATFEQPPGQTENAVASDSAIREGAHRTAVGPSTAARGPAQHVVAEQNPFPDPTLNLLPPEPLINTQLQLGGAAPSRPLTASAVSLESSYPDTSAQSAKPQCQMKNAHLDSRSERLNLGTKLEAGLGTPCSMLNESLNDSIRSHARRRCASFTPRSWSDPEPDTSWTDECPCGATLPCQTHGDLWRTVRYLKPSDPDYAAALTQAGIEFYNPTTEIFQPPSQTLSPPFPMREAPVLNAK